LVVVAEAMEAEAAEAADTEVAEVAVGTAVVVEEDTIRDFTVVEDNKATPVVLVVAAAVTTGVEVEEVTKGSKVRVVMAAVAVGTSSSNRTARLIVSKLGNRVGIRATKASCIYSMGRVMGKQVHGSGNAMLRMGIVDCKSGY